jgi:hypothetical protein
LIRRGLVINAEQGVTTRCRLSWLNNSALVCEPKCGGGGGCRISANEYSCTHPVTWSPNKLLRSNSIFYLGCRGTDFRPSALDGPPGLIRPIRAVRGGGAPYTHWFTNVNRPVKMS